MFYACNVEEIFQLLSLYFVTIDEKYNFFRKNYNDYEIENKFFNMSIILLYNIVGIAKL